MAVVRGDASGNLTCGAPAVRDRLSEEYVDSRGKISIEEFRADLDNILRKISRFHAIRPTTRIFEVGAGLGWFEIICSKRGLCCSAIEPNPVIRQAALKLAQQHGADVDIRDGNIESANLGEEQYDVIIATSVFEHVARYGLGLAKVYEALRPGGVFYFYSTNKFSFRSGEYPAVPLYGWLPYRARRHIRISRQGPAIVDSSGMDFNQFTYWGLRRHLSSLGFSRVLDRVDFLDPDDSADRPLPRNLALRAAKALPPARLVARVFASGNSFICVK
jgi:SAM-dependent methyltransferase